MKLSYEPSFKGSVRILYKSEIVAYVNPNGYIMPHPDYPLYAFMETFGSTHIGNSTQLLKTLLSGSLL